MVKRTKHDERQHLDRVAALGCIVCRNEGYGETPAQVHHIRAGKGMGQRASHFETIPLCPAHHQHGPDAFHSAPRSWQRRFGSELDLLDQVRGLLNG